MHNVATATMPMLTLQYNVLACVQAPVLGAACRLISQAEPVLNAAHGFVLFLPYSSLLLMYYTAWTAFLSLQLALHC